MIRSPRFIKEITIAIALLVMVCYFIFFNMDKSYVYVAKEPIDEKIVEKTLIPSMLSDEIRSVLTGDASAIAKHSEINKINIDEIKLERINLLIKRGNVQLSENKRLLPLGDNAFASFSLVFEMDEGNTLARNGIKRIVNSYEMSAREKFNNKEFELSILEIKNGLKVDSTHLALLGLKNIVEKRLSDIIATKIKRDERKVLVNQLLSDAEKHLKDSQLTSPTGKNAYEKYNEVLSLMPGNLLAKEGIGRVADKFYQLALDNKQVGSIDESVFFINKGLEIQANNVLLLKFKEDLIGIRFNDRLKMGGLGPLLVYIPAGGFKMGDVTGNGFPNENPVHDVRIGNEFYAGQYEITFSDYDKFTHTTGVSMVNDNGGGRGKMPVINVSWRDATLYTIWLTQQTGKNYRLPTEAEWEYIARAGTNTDYWWGREVGVNRANCKGCGNAVGGKKTSEVGVFTANAYGLFDTAGNVYELTSSKYSDEYQGQELLIVGKISKGDMLVARGGSWFDDKSFSRSAMRLNFKPDFRAPFLGFRVIREQ